MCCPAVLCFKSPPKKKKRPQEGNQVNLPLLAKKRQMCINCGLSASGLLDRMLCLYVFDALHCKIEKDNDRLDCYLFQNLILTTFC